MANGQLIANRTPSVSGPKPFYRLNIIDNLDGTCSVYVEDRANSDGVSDPAAVTAVGLQIVGSPAAGITGSGTVNTIAKFTAAHVIGNSLLTDDGAGSLAYQNTGGGAGFTLEGNASSTISITGDTSAGTINLTGGGNVGNIEIKAYRTSTQTHALVEGLAARGTLAAPVAINSGDSLFRLNAGGWDGTSFFTGAGAPSAKIDFVAAENFTGSTEHAADIFFRITGAGATALSNLLILQSTGLLSFAGKTSSTPALKNSGATLQARLADDSNFANFSAAIVNAAAGTATPAAGSTAARLLLGTTAGFGIYYGSNAPTVVAAQGSLYLRSDGSTNITRAYIATDSAGTWTPINTVG